MTPLRVISWQRAVVLSYLGKVEIVEEYDERVCAPSITIKTPAVVRQRRSVTSGRRKPSFCRSNVFSRDGYRCQYCGVERAMKELTFDHVVPRSRGGKTTWENIVTSCPGCNRRKGGRTPEEAGMKLHRAPTRPTGIAPLTVRKIGIDIPGIWKPYCK
jgi:5-methylcytosine-specific restriction endonuclease McrA